VRGEPIKFSPSDIKEDKAPAVFGFFRLPLRWVIVGGLAALIGLIIFFLLKPTPYPYLCDSMMILPPMQRYGYDDTTYQVHYDFTRGKEQIDERACGREVWISLGKAHPQFGSKFVYLVDGYRKRVSNSLYLENPDGSLRRPEQ